MSGEPVVVRPSLPRLWLVFIIFLLPIAVAAAAMSSRYEDPFDLWFFLGVASLMLVAASLMSALFARALWLSFGVSEEGLESRLPPSQGIVRWEDIDKVRVGMPFVFYMAGRPFAGFPFPTLIFLPSLWLVKNRDEFRRALERYAPEGHVLRRVYLKGEGPLLREVLVLCLLVAAAAVAFFLHDR